MCHIKGVDVSATDILYYTLSLDSNVFYYDNKLESCKCCNYELIWSGLVLLSILYNKGTQDPAQNAKCDAVHYILKYVTVFILIETVLFS